jgi:hypothetical protein
MNETSHCDLSDYELEQLLISQTGRVNYDRMRRLQVELRRLREQAGERERMAAGEVQW